LIDEYIHSERDRALLKRRFVDGLTFEKLSEEFDLSVPQIQRIYTKSKNLLFSRMDKIIK